MISMTVHTQIFDNHLQNKFSYTIIANVESKGTRDSFCSINENLGWPPALPSAFLVNKFGIRDEIEAAHI